MANDALLNGAKVAGILLETVALSAGQMALAIGVGVNLKNAPEASNLENRALPPASIYGLTGQVISPEAFLPTLAAPLLSEKRNSTPMGSSRSAPHG